MNTKSRAESMAAESEKYIVKYRRNYYNIAQFLHKHPGGVKTLKGLKDMDMTERFLKAPPHSDAAMYLMKEYEMNYGLINGRNKDTSNQIRYEQSNNNLDESLEHLVDWSKPMLAQIPNITKYYDEWVHKPVDRPLRIFGPWYLEMCTKTPWWVVLIFWMPIITMITVSEISASSHNLNEYLVLIFFFTVGIFIWTLIEYSLHRWVFHMKTSDTRSAFLCSFHFLIHGLHHKVPFDALRLVFPPLPGLLLASLLYAPFSIMLPHPRIFLAGGLFGYLCYDMMHYYLHYGDPKLRHFYQMKRYHYHHHFAHQDKGYGISSPLWDLIFQTRIRLRNLKFRLHWS